MKRKQQPIRVTQHIYGDGLTSDQIADLTSRIVRHVQDGRYGRSRLRVRHPRPLYAAGRRPSERMGE